MHTGEMPPPLPAAGEATTSPQLPNHSIPAAAAMDLCPATSIQICGIASCCSQLHEGFGASGNLAMMVCRLSWTLSSNNSPGQTTLSVRARRSPRGLVSKPEFAWLHRATRDVFQNNIFALSGDFSSKISITNMHMSLGASSP